MKARTLIVIFLLLAFAGSARAQTGFSNGIIVPAQGGVGAMTGAAMWARYFGDGSDGAGPASGTLTAGQHIFNFTSWNCTGTITYQSNIAPHFLSQGAVTLGSACILQEVGGNTIGGDNGGAGGSGGSGAANSSASSASAFYGSANAISISASAGASSSSAGNAGGAINAFSIAGMLANGPWLGVFGRGAGIGTAGGSSGGAAGKGGNYTFIAAPSITIASGATIDAEGFEGGDSAANSTGAGGGGGGAPIILATYAGGFTDNGGVYKYGGGPGGNCTTPSINATGGGCDKTGCGTGAVFTITALSGGGLSAGSISLTNAGSGYKTAPTCTINVGSSGLIGSPACHFAAPVAGALALPVIDTAGSGGTLTTFTTCFIGGYGANGWFKQLTIQ